MMKSTTDVAPTGRLACEQDLLLRFEQLHVDAWPALATIDVDGFTARLSGGGSKRANSVSCAYREPERPIDYDRVLRALSDVYAARGQPLLIQHFDAGPLPELADRLLARQFRTVESTTTMVKTLAADGIDAGDDVQFRSSRLPSENWLEVYLGAITADRRDVNRRIIASMTCERAFFTADRGGCVASTALAVRKGDLAVIECVATRAEARRQGAAREVLGRLEGWAARNGIRHLALQVVAGNHAATALYQDLGFVPRDRNRFLQPT